MKSSKLILALWLGASAFALTSPQKQANPPAVAPPAVAPPSAPSPKASAPVTGAHTSTPAAAPQKTRVQRKWAPDYRRPVATHSSAQPGSIESVPARAPAKRGRASRPVSRVTSTGEPVPAHTAPRDPFVSPVVERFREAASCTGTGRQCLLVGEISLRGVVHSPSGSIAVVVNGDHTYFLRENDPLADGAVERIGKDAIILRERSSDAVGRPLTREVTKKLGQSAD